MIKLSKRLEMVASLISKNSKVADIGADHGYLISYLVEYGLISRAYACENKKGPFSRLKENIKEYNLLDKIQVELSDGISTLPTDIDTVIIAGMGGDTVKKIIYDSLDKLININCFIISSHTKMYEVRETLTSLGYYIEDENACFDEDKFYEVSKFIKGKKEYSKIEIKYGPILLKQKNKELLNKLTLEILNNEKIATLDFIPLSKKNKLQEENNELKQIINMIK